MTVYNYCTPEWLEESARHYAENTDLQKKMEKLSTKMSFRITADTAQGIDRDMIFAAFIDGGRLTKLSFVTEEEAEKESDYILAATPREWIQVLRKKNKFIARFMMQEIQLEHGEKVDVLRLAPYTNDLVDVLTQVEIRYPDEMSPEEIEEYRAYLNDFRSKSGL